MGYIQGYFDKIQILQKLIHKGYAMKKFEKKFWNILNNLFVGEKIEGYSGFANLMQVKFNYFEKVKNELVSQINQICTNNNDFKEELYNKLYSFFHRYFNESGSIYYNYTPLFYNIYTQAYQSDIPFTNYEQVFSDRQDTYLFYKTKMLYYVKSDKTFKDLEIDYRGGGGQELKIKFDTSGLGDKKGNEKIQLVYELFSLENSNLVFKTFYSVKNKKTNISEIHKKIKKMNSNIKEEDIQKWFQIFERQSNIDYFINKNAKKFLSEQLNLWIYQYMFSQEVEFSQKRIQEIQDFKNIANQIIHFISQFEDELAKIWNKPRFVLNSNLIVTLDRLQDKGFDISKLTSHPNFSLQEREWNNLKIRNDTNLIENPYLPIDTQYFQDLKEEIENLFDPDELDGLLIKSENYQALNTLLPRFKNTIDLIYIDPPFNTGSDFAYIDRFQDSTWLSLMENRLELARDLLSDKGSFYLHLDYNANYLGRNLLNNILGSDNFINEIIWNYRGTTNTNTKFAPKHDVIFLYKKNKHIFNFNDVRIPYEDSEKFLKDKDGKFYKMWKKDQPYYPPQKFENGQWILLGKAQYDVWNDIPSMATAHGKEFLNFSTQKQEKLIQRIIQASSNQHSLVLDYHLGSGTTIATAQKLGRKWIGIEMGNHFYEIVIPRMKKVLGGFECGISKEVTYRGGGIFKYYELEQYEQILKKIKYSPTPQDFLDSRKSNEIKDCFLFDKKLSEAIIEESQGFKFDISKLYKNIDLRETIHNLTGKSPLKITDQKVVFKDCEMNLLEVLRPLLIW